MDFTDKNTELRLNHQTLDKVSHCLYLGSNIAYDGNSTLEIMTRNALTLSAFNKLSNI